MKPTITLLIVEDDSAFLDATMLMALRHLHLVFRARDGEEALLLLNAYGDSIDVVVLDWTVRSNITGAALVASMRRVKPDMSLVVMTDLQEKEVLLALPHNEVPFFLRKPFLPNELADVVSLAVFGSE